MSDARTYKTKFHGGYRCEFLLTPTVTEQKWAPTPPPESWLHWRNYYRWRDRCLDDYAKRVGIFHRIVEDQPWIGWRMRAQPLIRDARAAYAYASALRQSVTDPQTKGDPEFRARVLEFAETTMMLNAPTESRH